MNKTQKSMEQQKRRGGRREGAGRPRTSDSRLYAFRADKETEDYIDSHENKTEFIRNCISLFRDTEEQTRMENVRLQYMGDVFPATRVRPLKLPFFDVKVVAGFPIPLNNDELSQDIELLRMLCPNPESSYLIRVQGSSMIDAGIYDGDIIIVDKANREPTSSEVAVCELNGEYTLKRVSMKDGKAWLIPANPDFPKIEVTDADEFSVWGTVTYIIHKPRR